MLVLIIVCYHRIVSFALININVLTMNHVEVNIVREVVIDRFNIGVIVKCAIYLVINVYAGLHVAYLVDAAFVENDGTVV